MIYRLVLNEDVARDLTQEVFIKVYENLSSFREESQVYTWIHRIALNHTLNFLKKEKRRKYFALLDKDFIDLFRGEETEATHLPESSPATPDQIVENEERQRIIQSALAELPAKYRVPFSLHRFEEMSYQEIAESLNISLGAVEARIHRAKKMFIKSLEPWLKDL